MTSVSTIHRLAQHLWDNGNHDSAVKEILRLTKPYVKPSPQNALTLPILKAHLRAFVQCYPPIQPEKDPYHNKETDGREGILTNHTWYESDSGRYYFKLTLLTGFLQKLGFNTQRFDVSKTLGELPHGGGRHQLSIERSGVTVAYFHAEDIPR